MKPNEHFHFINRADDIAINLFFKTYSICDDIEKKEIHSIIATELFNRR